MGNCLPGARFPQNFPLGIEWTVLNWMINLGAPGLWWDVLVPSFSEAQRNVDGVIQMPVARTQLGVQ